MIHLSRKIRLKKDARAGTTGLIPLSQIRAMAAVLDAAGNGLEESREAIMRFCRANKIELTVLYVDFGNAGTTCSDDTILSRDLNWYGCPSKEKAGTFLGKRFDCFICLSDSGRFCIEYLAKAADARFKLGIRAVSDDPYDVIVTPPTGSIEGGTSQKDLFLTMKGIIEKIR